MDFFLNFYFSALEICKDMLSQFVLVANFMITPNDTLSKFFNQPISIITIMVGSGVTVFIGRALIKFFSGF